MTYEDEDGHREDQNLVVGQYWNRGQPLTVVRLTERFENKASLSVSTQMSTERFCRIVWPIVKDYAARHLDELRELAPPQKQAGAGTAAGQDVNTG